MIRDFKISDMNDVLNIWLEASIEAHGFIGREFWESKIDVMRETYLPSSESYVFLESGKIKGFVSLSGDTLAAMFVSPCAQGCGIGHQLMDKVKSLRKELYLTVYQGNTKSIEFYRNCGFTALGERVDGHTGHMEICMRFRS